MFIQMEENVLRGKENSKNTLYTQTIINVNFFKNPEILKMLVSALVHSDGRKSFDERRKFQKYLTYSNRTMKTKCEL